MSDLDLTDVQNALKEEMEKAGNKSNGWIPCSERLPENDKFVLVTYKRRDFVTNPTKVNIGWIKYGCWHCYTELYVRDTDVLAWMPLPEPYKEENNG